MARLPQTVLARVVAQQPRTAPAPAEAAHKILGVGVISLLQVDATTNVDHQKSLTALAPAVETHKILAAVAERLGLVDATTNADHQKSTTALGRAEAAHRISAAVAERLGLVDATASADHQKSMTALAAAVETHRILDVAVDNYLQYQMGIVTLAQVPQFVRPLHVYQIFSTPTTMLGTDVKRRVL